MVDQINVDQRNGIKELLASGKKIEAIKLYREFTGKGLKESKEYVDEMISELIEHNPEKYSRLSSSGSGCRSTAVFFIFAGVGVFALLKLLV